MRCVRLYQLLPTKACMAFFFFFAGKAHVSCAAGRVCLLRCMRRVCAGANLPRCKLRKAVHVFSVRKMHVCALLAAIRFPLRRALCRMENFAYEEGHRNSRRGKGALSHPYSRALLVVRVKLPAKPGAWVSLRRASYWQASGGAARFRLLPRLHSSLQTGGFCPGISFCKPQGCRFFPALPNAGSESLLPSQAELRALILRKHTVSPPRHSRGGAQALEGHTTGKPLKRY